MTDEAIAFVMNCDSAGLSLAEGIAAAEKLCEEIMTAAEDRSAYVE